MQQSSSANSSGGRGGRFAELVSSIPVATRLLIFINLLVFIYDALESVAGAYSICDFQVLTFRRDWYRLVTSAYFHGGVLHILFNMLTLLYLGKSLEYRWGSVCFLGLVLLFSVFNGFAYLGVGYVWALLKQVGGYCKCVSLACGGDCFGECAVGFSGVLFAMIMLDVKSSPQPTRNVFGFCQVPSWTYPWVLLVAFSLMMQSVSFIGHLAGILVGWLYCQGLFDWFTLKRDWIRRFENSECMERFTALSFYHKAPLEPVLVPPENRLRELCSACCARVSRTASRPATYFQQQAQDRNQRLNRYERVDNQDVEAVASDNSNTAAAAAAGHSLEMTAPSQPSPSPDRRPPDSDDPRARAAAAAMARLAKQQQQRTYTGSAASQSLDEAIQESSHTKLDTL